MNRKIYDIVPALLLLHPVQNPHQRTITFCLLYVHFKCSSSSKQDGF